jgi:hypothetical protein
MLQKIVNSLIRIIVVNNCVVNVVNIDHIDDGLRPKLIAYFGSGMGSELYKREYPILYLQWA